MTTKTNLEEWQCNMSTSLKVSVYKQNYRFGKEKSSQWRESKLQMGMQNHIQTIEEQRANRNNQNAQIVVSSSPDKVKRRQTSKGNYMNSLKALPLVMKQFKRQFLERPENIQYGSNVANNKNRTNIGLDYCSSSARQLKVLENKEYLIGVD